MSTDRFEMLRKSSDKESDLLVEFDRYENGESLIRIAHAYRQIEDGSSTRDFDGLLVDANGMDERLPIDKKFKLQGQTSLTVANSRHSSQTPADPMPRFSDLLGDWIKGAKVTIRQYFAGCTWQDVENEIVFTGWVLSDEPIYDENTIKIVASPYKKYQKLPPYTVNPREYTSKRAETGESVIPVVLGKLNYEYKNNYGSGYMAADFQGALCISKNPEIETSGIDNRRIPWRPRRENNWIKKIVDDIWLAVSALESKTIAFVWSDGTLLGTSFWSFENGDADGPSWRTLALLKILGTHWDADKEWTCDVEGMKYSGALVRDPIRTVREILVQIYGMNWTGSGWLEIDNTSAQLNMSSWLAGENLHCDGILDRKRSLEKFLSQMMDQFPFWIYRGRDGRFYFKKWERKPDVDYTDIELSYENHVIDIEILYRRPKGPIIDLLFWPHLGRSISQALPIPLDRGYWQHAYVNLEVEDSGYRLASDWDDVTLSFTMSGSGHHPTNGDLIMIGRELGEVRLPISGGIGSITVYGRRGNGTKAVQHKTDDRVYILHADSAVGDIRHVQRGRSPIVTGQTCKKIYLWEDGAHFDTVEIGDLGWKSDLYLYQDMTLAMFDLKQSINASGSLQGNYECEWDPLVNFITIRTTNSVQFYIAPILNDWMVKMMGWWTSTGMAAEHTGTQPARFREAQLTYDFSLNRSVQTETVQANLIVGEHLNRTALADYGAAGCDLTPMVICDYHFDTGHRPMRQVKFQTSDRFINLRPGMVFPFASDINDRLRLEGLEWTGLNWRIIEGRRISLNQLEFLAEEAT